MSLQLLDVEMPQTHHGSLGGITEFQGRVKGRQATQCPLGTSALVLLSWCEIWRNLDPERGKDLPWAHMGILWLVWNLLWGF